MKFNYKKAAPVDDLEYQVAILDVRLEETKFGREKQHFSSGCLENTVPTSGKSPSCGHWASKLFPISRYFSWTSNNQSNRGPHKPFIQGIYEALPKWSQSKGYKALTT